MTGDKSLFLGNASIGGRRLYVKGMQSFAYSINVDGLAPRRFRYDRATFRATPSPSVLRHGKQSKLTVKGANTLKWQGKTPLGFFLGFLGFFSFGVLLPTSYFDILSLTPSAL